MIKLIQKWWRYLTASLTGRFNERADPKVQLEQALADSQEQHRRLVEQAANVIANQKQTELRLNRSMEELEKLNGLARQAVRMADDATKRGDAQKAIEYTSSAESFANRLIAVEKDVDGLKTLHLQATQASDQAKAAVQQNSTVLQRKLAERQKLLSQLDQAKMQEQVNATMNSLQQTVGAEVPTLDEVRNKIEARYAKALGTAELTETSVENRMLEVEQAAMSTEAQARLASIREQLGLGPTTAQTDAIAGADGGTGATAPAVEPGAAPQA